MCHNFIRKVSILRKISKKFIVLVVSAVLIIVGAMNFNNSVSNYNSIQMDFSDFVQETENNNVHDVMIRGTKVVGHLNNGTLFSTIVPFQDRDLVQRLMQHKVKIKVTGPEENSSFTSIFISLLPMLFMIGLWVLLFKQMNQGASRAMSLGDMKTNKNDKEKTTFNDVAGAQEAKEDLQEIVDLLRDPAKYEKLGAKMPKGALLVGPPGTGKTLLARAVAGEAKCSFLAVSGSEFVEMFVGVGALRVRKLFEKAKQISPCVVFIDEIDSLGRHRGVGLGGGNDEREQTLNELLVQLDGFEKKHRVFVLAATNRPDILDKALTRSGRFDRQIMVGLPDLNQRLAILSVHTKKIKLAEGVNLKAIARGTPGFSGADLANLSNEAALIAARANKKSIDLKDLEAAKDKILMGPEKKTLLMSENERKLTAYHEAGHALVAFHCKNSDPIHKATIMPRGNALGMVVQLPENDRVSVSRAYLEERIRILMGGRVAEEQIFGEEYITTGASNDIKVATDIAKKMVLEYGMSKLGGMMNYLDSNEIHFGQVTHTSHHSQEVARMLDAEIKKILDSAYVFAKRLLDDNSRKLHNLANELLEKETLTGDEVRAILSGKKLSGEENKLQKDNDVRKKVAITKSRKTPTKRK